MRFVIARDNSETMLKFMLTSMLLAVATALLNLQPLGGRILGGENVIIEEFPYMVALYKKGNFICGGSIITENFVVTAAHCMKKIVDPEDLTVRAGSTFKGVGGILIEVEDIYMHPKYINTSINYDISLLELSYPLPFSYGIQTINLPDSSSDVEVGTDCIVTGWGKVAEKGQYSKQLLAIQVQVISMKDCKKRFPHTRLTDQMICAIAPISGEDACQGDSGGPLVCDGKLEGLVSWGLGCGRPGMPGVYTNIRNVRNFIKTITDV